mmetsp:Transcript_51553/g.167322  ORF Transcript_51553/g.167322 Transcript_51553/m.167322 type:complete len:535 (-) Transcript_51553:125-1729(-)|eukprot:CAMPEP_0203884156 /NCGR_PEP_ID=MMETSP0359-20131031/28218_1 /ASSEMBLY_ACC=CAM_ASM_000338 /TAXON_ID=268821 /ORGANISM="Scrippsiella Hangoei, Strain SHTV-5" /LENGTH=534 /DNA_ID=CAMNT_0050804555 /DNA_START=49 /DNA_END=1653 /DNA_ORIENTATION=-
MSVITRMMDRMFGKPEVKVVILGFDSPGRTTALYKMKLGEVVTTIPTIGFNVETVQHDGLNLTFWDVGGRSKIRALWRHYYGGTHAIIFAVRSGKRDFEENEDEYRTELCSLMGEDELRDVPLLVWANFQDLPDALSVREITDRLELHKIRNRTWHIQGTCAPVGDGLRESLDWLSKTVKVNKQSRMESVASAFAAGSIAAGSAVASAVSAGSTAIASGARSVVAPSEDKQSADKSVGRGSEGMETLMLSWLEEVDDEEATLQQFIDGKLKQWGHKHRLLVSWLLVRRHGRKEAIRLLFDGARGILGDSFHETTLYFWVHMVHYASELTTNPLGSFKGFLLLNPQLVNSDLLLEYYTQEAIWQNPDAQAQVVMPDKKPLPSLLGGAAVSAKNAASDQPPEVVHELCDEEFLELFSQRKPPSWGHETKLRAIWLLLRLEGRRRGGTSRVFKKLQQAEAGMHHITESYFWIQMVTYGGASMGDTAECFAEFIRHDSCKQFLDPGLILKHYSDGVLAEGVAEFRLPDIKPMPNVVAK